MEFDRYHKWMVVAATFFLTTIAHGNDLGFGAYFTPLLNTFGKSRLKTATVHAILRGFMNCFGVISGLITTKLGIKKTLLLGGTILTLGYTTSYLVRSLNILYLTIGVFSGIGSSILFNVSTAAIGQLFSGKMRGVAISIQTAGISIGGMVFPEMYYILLSHYGLNGAFLVTGGIVFNSFVAIHIIGLNNENRSKPVKEDDASTHFVSDSQTNPSPEKGRIGNYFGWVNGPCAAVIFGSCICNGSVLSLLGLVVDVFIWKGAPQVDGITCLAIVNAAGLGSRIYFAVIKRFCNISSTVAITQLMMYSIICAVGVCIMIVGTTSHVLMVGGALIGIQLGTTMVSTMIFIMEQISSQHMPVAIGAMSTTLGIVTLTTGPLFGAIYDWTESYISLLILVAALQVVGCFFYLITIVLRYRTQKRNRNGKS